MAQRKQIARKALTSVLSLSSRRCCLCFALDNDLTEKLGQIAHLDRNCANARGDNLVFLCLNHHSLYDSSASQHKGYTASEVKAARDVLYDVLYKELKKHRTADRLALVANTAVKSAKNIAFVSYSRHDSKWLERLTVHLAPLQQNGQLSLWGDNFIRPGDHFLDKIKEVINSARLAILLVTPEFLASEFIRKVELPQLLSRAQSGQLKICWIYIRACLYMETPLKQYQAANDTKKPLRAMSGAKADEQLLSIAEAIKGFLV
jgi:TIR domain